ncbi:MAG: hypothetical protein GF355_11940 [Candidatus Eisenbacteria bacterium]|nr:hypothetical protein [Candidatus Eisenbacteria bacterium]
MHDDKRHRVIDLCFDRSRETWFVDLRPAGRLELTHHTLAHLVRLYNSIHRGDPLYLFDRERVEQFHQYNQRLTRTVRDLYHFIDQDRGERPLPRARRWIGRLLAELLPGRRRA